MTAEMTMRDRERRRPLRILLVDDEPALRKLLRMTFESADVVVDEAASAIEAEETIQRLLPDVVVLDLHMPGMSGAELCGRLKADERTREVPIVMLTGASEDEARVAQEEGAEELLRKPFSPLELLAVVERLAGGRRATPAQPDPSPLAREHADEELMLYARDLKLLLELERKQRALLQQSYLATVTALASALESKDVATRDHSRRVERYATLLLEAVAPGQLAEEPATRFGFLLHDVGKIGIPDEILLKPGPLTEIERRRMQTHTLVGERMLRGVPFLRGAALGVVRSHHERWDGHGYPDGLAGEAIPLAARVFAVADTFDAMTSDRPYREALPWEAAAEEIESESGRQFDPDVVAALRGRMPAFDRHLIH